MLYTLLYVNKWLSYILEGRKTSKLYDCLSQVSGAAFTDEMTVHVMFRKIRMCDVLCLDIYTYTPSLTFEISAQKDVHFSLHCTPIHWQLVPYRLTL